MTEVFKVALVILIAFFVLACNRSGSNSESTNAETVAASPKPNASPLSDFEESLKFVRNGQFTYIYVISRKDGKPLDAQDKEFLDKYAPQIVDRAATKDKTKIVVGTNFNLEEGNLTLIKKRFNVEDYSGR